MRIDQGDALLWGDRRLLVPALLESSKRFGGEKVTSVSVGFRHVLFLTDAGSVFALGKNSSYELGTGTKSTELAPVRVSSGLPHGAAGIAAGRFFSACLARL